MALDTEIHEKPCTCGDLACSSHPTYYIFQGTRYLEKPMAERIRDQHIKTAKENSNVSLR